MLKDLGFKVRQVKIEDRVEVGDEFKLEESAPFVLAEKIVDAKLPTLLFYAHYDIQPVDEEKWTTKPLVLTERDGRLYGRGSSDDKGGIIGITTALGVLLNRYKELPVNVKVLFEGEEEYGSSHMGALIKQEGDRLKADGLVILDGANVDVDTGTLTSSTRGLVNLHLKVTSMEKPIHSGMGCIAPDPSLVLADLMASLREPRKIPGFMDDCQPLTEKERELLSQCSQSPEAYAEGYNLLKGAPLRGDPKTSVYERVCEEPSISFVNGRWGKPNGGNSIQESASCQVGVRLTGGQHPEKIAKVLTEYLESHPTGKGFKVQVEQTEPGCFAWKGDLSRPMSKMYLEAMGENFKKTGAQPVGGALPLLRDFEEAFPKMEILIPGVEDPKC